MAKEIERKFLVDINKWNKKGTKVVIVQAYLCADNNKVIRIRVEDKRAFLTIKGNLKGITRDEFEYAILLEEAKQMLSMCDGITIEKTRYVDEIMGKVWEVDVFEGLNEGLVVAEIELESENEEFELPEWIASEVSSDVRYYNFNLSKTPYSLW